MSLMRADVHHQTKKPIRVEESYLLPDGVTWSGIIVRSPGAWSLALTVEEAERLGRLLHSAALKGKRDRDEYAG